MEQATLKMGQRGAVIIPAELRRALSLEHGSLLIASVTDEGLVLRPAIAVPIVARKKKAKRDSTEI